MAGRQATRLGGNWRQRSRCGRLPGADVRAVEDHVPLDRNPVHQPRQETTSVRERKSDRGANHRCGRFDLSTSFAIRQARGMSLSSATMVHGPNHTPHLKAERPHPAGGRVARVTRLETSTNHTRVHRGRHLHAGIDG